MSDWSSDVCSSDLGSGRPFLVEVQNARRLPSVAFVREIETNINNLENKLVSKMPIVSTLLPHIKKTWLWSMVHKTFWDAGCRIYVLQCYWTLESLVLVVKQHWQFNLNLKSVYCATCNPCYRSHSVTLYIVVLKKCELNTMDHWWWKNGRSICWCTIYFSDPRDYYSTWGCFN